MSAASAGDRPRVGIKQHIRAEVAETEGAYLFSEQGTTVLQGALAESVVSLLDGTRDRPAIAAAMAEKLLAPAEAILAPMDGHLRQLGRMALLEA